MKNHETKCPHVGSLYSNKQPNTDSEITYTNNPRGLLSSLYLPHDWTPLRPFPPMYLTQHSLLFPIHSYPQHHGGRFPAFSFFPQQAGCLPRRPPSTEAPNFQAPPIHQFTLQIPSIDLVSQGRDRQSQILVVH